MGWIALDRGVEQHWIYVDDSHFKAWVNMLFRCDFDGPHMGSFVSSQEALARTWKWSEAKTSRFLSRLKKAAMISITAVQEKCKEDARHSARRFTILNYAHYQSKLDLREVRAQGIKKGKCKKNASAYNKDQQGTSNKGSEIDPFPNLDPLPNTDPCLPAATQWARVTVDGERFENLRITKEQLARLVEKNGKPCIEFYLRRAAGFEEAAKKKFNSRDGHYRTLCSWIAKDRAEKRGFFAQGVVEPKRITKEELERRNKALAL